MKRHLIWFRNDLRTTANPALVHARQHADELAAVYIDCPGQWREHHRSARQLDFVARHLDALQHKLEQAGIPLHRLQCEHFDDVPQQLQTLMREQDFDALFANREPGINETRRDRAVGDQLAQPFELFDADCILPPGRVLTGQGDMYRIFTPFRKAWLHALKIDGYSAEPDPFETGSAANTDPADDLWPVGEAAAQERLRSFCADGLQDYGEARDYPSQPGTSGLSPYLAIGVLSASQCLQALERQLGYLPFSSGETGFEWLNELIWREFYRHLMAAFPHLSMNQPFNSAARLLQWEDNDDWFEAWCAGRTGFPIVDAAMRCLVETGWMHNRLRMIVASFLVKDLQIDWRRGEDWFMAQLIDGDFPSNNGGWQWSAGTGADAAPYFRIFNPTAQGERWDKEGEFIRRWVAELADVPDRHIHTPHEWLAQQGREDSYPAPLVDHKQARERCLQRYQVLKSKG